MPYNPGQPTLILPNGYGPLVGITASQAIGLNMTRQGLIFFNPGSVLIAICPSTQGLVPAINGAGSVTLAQYGLMVLDTPVVTAAWSAIAASGANNPLTIWEW